MYYELVLLAAGQGKRMGAAHNKILLHLLGKPVIVYALETFMADPACQHIILVTQPDEQDLLSGIVKKYFRKQRCPVTIVAGGSERQDSVYEGLKKLKQPEKMVMVHDGARPFVTRKHLKGLYAMMEVQKAAILGVPVKDTIKKIVDGKVVETVPRETLWQIQTPQAFIGCELIEVHQKAKADGFVGTDDASLMEQYSSEVIHVVLGNYENIKLTTPDDMLIGEAILKRRTQARGRR